MPTKCIYVSEEYAREAQARGISWSEASRVGMALLLKENVCPNEIITKRKGEFLDFKMEKLAKEYLKLKEQKDGKTD